MQAIVTDVEGAKGFIKGRYPEIPEITVPFGTVLFVKERFGVVAEMTMRGQSIVVPAMTVAQCLPRERDVGNIQFCLNKQGFDAGKWDNQMGPKTEAAMAAFFQKHDVDAMNLSLSCKKHVICTPALNEGGNAGWAHATSDRKLAFKKAADQALVPRALRRRWAAAEAAFVAGKCETLKGFNAQELRTLSVEDCTKRHQLITDQALAVEYFAQRACDKLAELPKEAWRANTPANCERFKAREENTALLEKALAQLDCEGAAKMAKELGTWEERVVMCRETLQSANDKADFEEAMAQNDCAAVRVLQSKVGRSDAFEACSFNTVLTKYLPALCILGRQNTIAMIKWRKLGV